MVDHCVICTLFKPLLVSRQRALPTSGTKREAELLTTVAKYLIQRSHSKMLARAMITKRLLTPITWGCPSLESLLNSLDVVFRSDRLGHLHHARPPASFGAWMSLRAYLGQYLLVRLVNELKGARETRALFRRLPGGSQTRRSNCAWAGLVVVSASSETYTATTLSCRLFANCFFISCRR